MTNDEKIKKEKALSFLGSIEKWGIALGVTDSQELFGMARKEISRRYEDSIAAERREAYEAGREAMRRELIAAVGEMESAVERYVSENYHRSARLFEYGAILERMRSPLSSPEEICPECGGQGLCRIGCVKTE